MTDQQINQAIAEACGWTEVQPCTCYDDVPRGRAPGKLRLQHIEDYCNDLNAMADAEKTIFPYYATVYANKLARVTGAEMSDDTDYFCATARQRAEAFLRTLGKWEKATDKESLTVEATTEQSSVVQKEGHQ